MSDDGGLRRLFQTNVTPGHLQPVETGLISTGVPDMNFCVDGAEGWVEMKQTDGWAVTLEPEQISWLCRRARNGGRVFVAVRRWHDGGPRKGRPVDELWLLRGEYAPDLRSMGLRWVGTHEPLTGPLLGRWTGGPAHWNWFMVRLLLATTPALSAMPRSTSALERTAPDDI